MNQYQFKDSQGNTYNTLIVADKKQKGIHLQIHIESKQCVFFTKEFPAPAWKGLELLLIKLANNIPHLVENIGNDITHLIMMGEKIGKSEMFVKFANGGYSGVKCDYV